MPYAICFDAPQSIWLSLLLQNTYLLANPFTFYRDTDLQSGLKIHVGAAY